MEESATEKQVLPAIDPEQRIFDVAINKDNLDWKGFLYQLIYAEHLDPWDIDLGVFTHKYLEALKNINSVDFDISGKFLTIAVFLLKTKAEILIDKDLRGMDAKIAELEAQNVGLDSLDSLEQLDDQLNAQVKKKPEYVLNYRNPLARKRKVNIFDLIKLLEKTFDQSNKRRLNFFQRHGDSKYSGPMYEKKPKDLKQVIEDLFDEIMGHFKDKKAHIHFSHLTQGISHRMGILEKFIPLLHLHNHDRLELVQDEHFGEIKICPSSESSSQEQE
jgi:chromatin segregation and condensation protein Rec8/ScpA/Scc1 (kleisin family)